MGPTPPVLAPASGDEHAEHRAAWPVRLRHLLAWRWFWPVVICGGFAIRWAFLWGGMFAVQGGDLHTGQINVWGDWPQHVGDAASFIYGDNFPPYHPRMSGVPYAYHYLSSLTGAMLIRFGMAPYTALALHSFVLSVFIALCLLAFALRLLRDTRAATLAVLLFLLGGGFGWLLVVQHTSPDNVLSAVWNHPWDSGQQRADHFWWENFYFADISPQRSVLYGLPLSLLILTLLFIGVQRWSWRPFVAAGVVVGLLPFAHLGALSALVMIVPMIALLFPTGDLRRPIGQWYPVRRWLVFGVIAVALAGPQLLLQQVGHPETAPGFAFHFGWLKGDDEPVWWFWLKNLGWFVPLTIVGLLRPSLFGRTPYRFLLAFMPIFIICNLVKLQTDPLDNIKALLYWNLAICILSAGVLVALWRAYRQVLLRTALVAAVAMTLLSGVLINLQQARGLDRPIWMSTGGDARRRPGAQRDRARRRLRHRAAAGPSDLDAQRPAGRDGLLVVAGHPRVRYPTTGAGAHGYLSRLAPDAQQMIDAYHIDYVAIGPREEDEYGPSLQQWLRRFPVAIQTNHYLIFAVSPDAQTRLAQRLEQQGLRSSGVGGSGPPVRVIPPRQVATPMAGTPVAGTPVAATPVAAMPVAGTPTAAPARPGGTPTTEPIRPTRPPR